MTVNATTLPINTRNQKIITALLLLGLFLAAWLPRTLGLNVFVTADERKWLVRAANFDYALAHGDLYHTYQREHPAVTNTWLGGLGVLTAMPGHAQLAPGYFNPDIEEMEAWLKTPAAGPNAPTPLAMLAWARFYTVLAVAVVLTLTFFPLRRLFRAFAAVLVALFVSLAPMTVGFTRQVQPDGLHAVFMYAALLYFLAWLYAGRRRRDLVGAGVLMGLGWLTKTPVLFLAPIGGLLILVEWWRMRRAGEGNGWRPLLLGYVLWGMIAAVVFFALWPALWVDPVGIFVKMYQEMSVYIEGHINPNYFMGQVTQDPGPLFYPVAVFFRITPAALIGFFLAAVGMWRRWPPLSTGTARRACWALVAFVLLFTAFMTLPAKKFDRYLLPAFFVLDVLAALGWSAAALWVWRWLQLRKPDVRWLPAAGAALVGLVGVLLLHGLFTFQQYPYYMTYFNPLAGGGEAAPKVLFVGWGEGLDEAGRWLSEQPYAEKRRVVSWYAGGPLSYFFPGQAVGVLAGQRLPWLDADYVATYINQVQREIPSPAALDFLARQTPVFTSTIGGMTMANVYDLAAIRESLKQPAPAPLELPSGQQWSTVKLTTLRSVTSIAAGSLLPVKTEWMLTPDAPADAMKSLRLSLRLIGPENTLIAQQDKGLSDDMSTQVFIPPDAAPGQYTLYALLYRRDTQEPLPGPGDGDPLVKLAEIAVTGE